MLVEMEDMTKGRCRSILSETASLVDMMTMKGAEGAEGSSGAMSHDKIRTHPHVTLDTGNG